MQSAQRYEQLRPVFTCSKLTIETLEECVKYVLKLTIKTPDRCQWRHSGIFIVNFDHISCLLQFFYFFNFEHVNGGWDRCI